jgi:hypothetical protein
MTKDVHILHRNIFALHAHQHIFELHAYVLNNIKYLSNFRHIYANQQHVRLASVDKKYV